MISETQQRPETGGTYEEHFPVIGKESGSLPFATFVQILLQGRRTILTTGLGALILATILAFLMPLNYTSSASFVPPGSSSGMSSAAAVMGQLSSLGGGAGLFGSKSQGDLYVGILKSHTISRDLVQRFNLKSVYKVKKVSQAEKILSGNSLFEVGTKDQIVTISVTDKSPSRARDLARGYLEALRATSAGLALTESSQRRLFYEQRLSREKDELANAEVALKQIQEKTGLIAPAGQVISGIQTLADLRAQITERQVRLGVLLQAATEQNPEVLRLRNEIGSLQAQVGQLENGEKSKPFGRLSASQVPGLELEYIRKARDVKYHETLFEIIAKQYEAARLDEEKDSPLQVLDQPTIPDTKSGPHRSIIMGIGLLVGLLGGAAWVLFQSVKRQSI